MTKSTVFVTNKSQAVRLPKPVALPANVKQVEITKIGHSRLSRMVRLAANCINGARIFFSVCPSTLRATRSSRGWSRKFPV